MNHSRLHKGFFIGLFLGLVGGLLLGWWLCSRGQTFSSTTTTKVDTIKYFKPIPIPKHELLVKGFSLPKIVFAPADTLVKTIIHTERGEETEVSFPIEQRVYQDSTYRAVISGAVVGDRRPTLDYIETYNRTTTSEVVLKPKKLRPYVGASVGIFGTWSVGVGGGLLIKDHHAVGAEYERTQNDNLVKLRYNYFF